MTGKRHPLDGTKITLEQANTLPNNSWIMQGHNQHPLVRVNGRWESHREAHVNLDPGMSITLLRCSTLWWSAGAEWWANIYHGRVGIPIFANKPDDLNPKDRIGVIHYKEGVLELLDAVGVPLLMTTDERHKFAWSWCNNEIKKHDKLSEELKAAQDKLKICEEALEAMRLSHDKWIVLAHERRIEAARLADELKTCKALNVDLRKNLIETAGVVFDLDESRQKREVVLNDWRREAKQAHELVTETGAYLLTENNQDKRSAYAAIRAANAKLYTDADKTSNTNTIIDCMAETNEAIKRLRRLMHIFAVCTTAKDQSKPATWEDVLSNPCEAQAP